MSRGLCLNVLIVIAMLGVPCDVRAAGGNTCVPSTCDAPEPTCAQQTTTGTNNCGGTCSKEFWDYCQIASNPACGETASGTRVCGGSCDVYGGDCPVEEQPASDWRIWGVAVPGDPEYGMVYPDPNTRDLVGLAAKGNVVIGDYTSQRFQNETVPILEPNSISNPDGRTHDYSIDPTDSDLGYHSYSQGGVMMFDGNYNAYDGGYKLNPDGSPVLDGDGNPVLRKFYESSLSDTAFQALVQPLYPQYYQTDQVRHIDAVLFTNHAVAGVTDAQTLEINGAMIGRDEAVLFGQNFIINHDTRLLNTTDQAAQITLPYGLKRPELTKWEECPAAGCPPLEP